MFILKKNKNLNHLIGGFFIEKSLYLWYNLNNFKKRVLIMNRGEKARKYFLDGYACAQSVVLAFNDILDISEDDLKK